MILQTSLSVDSPFTPLPADAESAAIWNFEIFYDYFNPGLDLLILAHAESDYVILEAVESEDYKFIEEKPMNLLYTETADIFPVSDRLFVYAHLLSSVKLFNLPKEASNIRRIMRKLQSSFRKHGLTRRNNPLPKRIINKKLKTISKEFNTLSSGKRPSKQESLIESIEKFNIKAKERYGKTFCIPNENELNFDRDLSSTNAAEENQESKDKEPTISIEKSERIRISGPIDEALKYLQENPEALFDEEQLGPFKGKIKLETSRPDDFRFSPSTYKNWIDYSSGDSEEKVFEFTMCLDYSIGFAYRNFRVPADITFEQLEHIIAKTVSWTGYPYHMGSFLFPKNKLSLGEFQKLKDIELVLDNSYEELLESAEQEESGINLPVDYKKRIANESLSSIETKKQRDFKLKDLIPKYSTFYFHYNFNKNWNFALDLTAIYDANDPKHPALELFEARDFIPPEDFPGSLREYYIMRDLDLFKEISDEEAEDVAIFLISNKNSQLEYNQLKLPKDLTGYLEETKKL